MPGHTVTPAEEPQVLAQVGPQMGGVYDDGHKGGMRLGLEGHKGHTRVTIEATGELLRLFGAAIWGHLRIAGGQCSGSVFLFVCPRRCGACPPRADRRRDRG
eukprot:1196245-Prorocentrum_minimum.AAC.3